MSRKLSPPSGILATDPRVIEKRFIAWRIQLCRRITEIRKRHNITHREFASLFGCTTGTSIRWGSGYATPDLPVLLEIVRKFDLDPAEIFGD